MIIRYLIIFDKSQSTTLNGTHVLKELPQFIFIYFLFIYT